MARALKIPRPRPDRPRKAYHPSPDRTFRTYLCPNADRRARKTAKREHTRLRRRAEKKFLDDTPLCFWGGWID